MRWNFYWYKYENVLLKSFQCFKHVWIHEFYTKKNYILYLIFVFIIENLLVMKLYRYSLLVFELILFHWWFFKYSLYEWGVMVMLGFGHFKAMWPFQRKIDSIYSFETRTQQITLKSIPNFHVSLSLFDLIKNIYLFDSLNLIDVF